MHGVATVLTYKSVDHMVGDGGTQSWRASRRRLRKATYVVCVRNQHGPYRAEGDEPHRHAFLVGKIVDVVDADNDPSRQKILFSAYALVDGLEMPLNGANPVQYWKDLKALGFDEGALEWREGNPKSAITRAKELVAAAHGVPVEAVQISISM